ncbi:MAG: serine hydrolase domain-containing protein [Planctomycetota bacterium]
MRSLSLATALALTTAIAPAQEAGLDVRLERLAEEIERKRVEQNIPAVSVSIVHDGEIVFARGFGTADLEEATPASADTVYSIGSTTKTFTSLLVGMLQEERRIGFDDLVSQHVPEFELFDSEADRRVTIRDLLSHRTGLPRLTMLWAGNRVDLATMLGAVSRAEPLEPFGEAWQYNNVMYAMAGIASANAAGRNWEALVYERLAEPLGMTSLSFGPSGLIRDSASATGYRWDEEEDDWDTLVPRETYLVAPAGAINASVLDMATYASLYLGGGVYEGTRYVEPRTLDEIWEEQMEITPGQGYGLGWFLNEHRGRRAVNHGGNIDGFASAFGMLPDDDIGVSALMNVTAAPLQSEILAMAYDAVLGIETSAGDPAALERFAGRYYFAPFEAWFTVASSEDGFTIDVPGQTNYELVSREGDGPYAFEFSISADITLDFVEAPDGTVVGLTFTQGGVTSELPKEDLEDAFRDAMDSGEPVTGEALRLRQGTFYFGEQDIDIEVLLNENERLALDVPGQTVYELKWPDANGYWQFSLTDQIRVRFLESDDGTVDSIEMHQGGQVFLLERTSGPPAREDGEPADIASQPESRLLPSLEEVLGDTPGAFSLPSGTRAIRLTGRIQMINQGVEGDVTLVVAGPERYVSTTSFGPFGTDSRALDVGRAVVRSSFEPDSAPQGVDRDFLALANPLLYFADPRFILADVEVADVRTIDGEQHVVVSGTRGEADPIRLIYEPQNFQLRRVESVIYNRTVGVRLNTTTRLSDFRDFRGLSIPHRIESANPAAGRSVLAIESVEFIPASASDPFAAVVWIAD